MSDEPLSQHCSLMAHPERTTLPSDCPENALYIKHTDEGGDFALNPIAPFPIVIEGGDGEDNVTVIGTPANPVLIDGGKGNDSVQVQGQASWPANPGMLYGGKGNDSVQAQGQASWLAGQLPSGGLIFLGALLIVFGAIALLGWRALSRDRVRAE